MQLTHTQSERWELTWHPSRAPTEPRDAGGHTGPSGAGSAPEILQGHAGAPGVLLRFVKTSSSKSLKEIYRSAPSEGVE